MIHYFNFCSSIFIIIKLKKKHPLLKPSSKITIKTIEYVKNIFSNKVVQENMYYLIFEYYLKKAYFIVSLCIKR